MSALRNVILTGELGRKYGRHHRFAIENPAEAIRALAANFKEFASDIRASLERGMDYRIVVGKRSITAEELPYPTGMADIKIVPVIAGAKDGATQFLVGAAIVASVFMTGGASFSWAAGITFSSFGAQVAFGVGAAMALGGITQMLAPQPPTPGASVNSYGFHGPVNTTQQGVPVPVGYGELIVGSAVISAGITVDQLSLASVQPTNVSAHTQVQYNSSGAIIGYLLFVSWNASITAVGYDVVVSGVGTAPRTQADNIIYSVPNTGPFTVTVNPVLSDGSYGTSTTVTSS